MLSAQAPETSAVFYTSPMNFSRLVCPSCRRTVEKAAANRVLYFPRLHPVNYQSSPLLRGALLALAACTSTTAAFAAVDRCVCVAPEPSVLDALLCPTHHRPQLFLFCTHFCSIVSTVSAPCSIRVQPSHQSRCRGNGHRGR